MQAAVAIDRKHECSITDLLYVLRRRCPGYASVIRQLRQISTEQVPTMGVSIQDGKYVLYYNPDWYRNVCNKSQALWTLRHEIQHLTHDHIRRYLRLLRTNPELAKFDNKELGNWAMDCSINSMVRHDTMFEAPAGVLFPSKLPIQDLWAQEGMTFEWYWAHFIEWVKKNPTPPRGGGNGEGPKVEDLEGNSEGAGKDPSEQEDEDEDQDGAGGGAEDEDQEPEDQDGAGGDEEDQDDGEEDQDDGEEDPQEQGEDPSNEEPAPNPHNWMDQIDKMSAEERESLENSLKRQFERIIKKAAEECRDDPNCKRHGTVPGELQTLFTGALKSKQLPWDEIFRALVHNSVNETLERNMARPSRRRGHLEMISPFPGKKVNPMFRIAFCVDTSGSMYDEDILRGLGVIEDIMASSPEIQCTVLEFDSRVHRTYDLGEGKKACERDYYGRGGTSFDPPFSWVKEREASYDLFITYTDGWAPNPQEENIPNQTPFIWLMTPRHDKPFDGNRGTYLVLEKD